MSGRKQKTVKLFTVKAWSANAIAFIEDRRLTREFSDWCGGWPCPVSPEMVTAAPAMLEALEGAIGALEFSRDYHSDLSNAEQAFAQDRLDAAIRAIARAKREAL